MVVGPINATSVHELQAHDNHAMLGAIEDKTVKAIGSAAKTICLAL